MFRIAPEEVLLWHLLEKQAEQVYHLLGAQYTKEILKMDLKMVLRRKKKGGVIQRERRIWRKLV